jgi:hypothetical protein
MVQAGECSGEEWGTDTFTVPIAPGETTAAYVARGGSTEVGPGDRTGNSGACLRVPEKSRTPGEKSCRIPVPGARNGPSDPSDSRVATVLLAAFMADSGLCRGRRGTHPGCPRPLHPAGADRRFGNARRAGCAPRPPLPDYGGRQCQGNCKATGPCHRCPPRHGRPRPGCRQRCSRKMSLSQRWASTVQFSSTAS